MSRLGEFLVNGFDGTNREKRRSKRAANRKQHMDARGGRENVVVELFHKATAKGSKLLYGEGHLLPDNPVKKRSRGLITRRGQQPPQTR